MADHAMAEDRTTSTSPADVGAPTAGSLESDAISLKHVLGEGFTSNGPLASAAVAFTATAVYGLGALPLVFVFGAIVALLWVNTPFQFSKRIRSAGGLYAFLRHSLGQRAALGGSSAYFLYYVLLVPGNALVAASLVEFVAGQLGLGLPHWSWIVVVALMVVPPYVISYFKLHASLTYGVITGAVEAVVLVVISITLIVKAGDANTASVYSPHLALHGWSSVAVGMAVAGTALGGPDAVCSLGEETRGGLRTIRRGLLTTQLAVIGLYLVFSYAATVGWGPTKMSGFAEAPAPLLTLVDGSLGRVAEIVVGVLVLNSIIGVNLAVNIAMGRMLYDQARLGAVWKGMARVHPVHRTPTAALTVALVIELAVAYAAGEQWGLVEGFVVCILAATAGAILSQLLTDLGLIVFRRHLDVGLVAAGVVPLVSIALLAYSIYGNFFPVTYPNVVAPLTVLGVAILAVLWALRRPGRRTPLDETPTDVGPASSRPREVIP